MKRGEIFMAAVNFTQGTGVKRRPVVIVQADRFNLVLRDMIVAGVTSNVHFAGPPNRMLIDPSTQEGSQSGLKYVSVVRADRLFTLDISTFGKKLGQLSPVLMAQLEICLRVSLDLP